MANRPTTPRITPVAHDEQDERMRELLPEIATPDGGVLNIFSTLVRHPGIFDKWARFGGKLLAGKLPRDRELLILRTGWRCQSEYEWGQHVLIGRAAGITDDEVRRIQEGPEAPGWSALDATLLRAADELHDDSCITDATWAALASRTGLRRADPSALAEPPVEGHAGVVTRRGGHHDRRRAPRG